MQTLNDVDLAIIGSGSAAFGAAIKATELGARVAMVERGTVGGTCVNIGCVPSKTLLQAAYTFHSAGHHPFHGVQTAAVSNNFNELVEQKDALVSSMRHEKYENLIAEYGWELISGEAHFTSPDTLTVGKRTLRAGAYVIATGARPATPSIRGLDESGYLTSTTAMELDHLPHSVVVIGAGYIALELGQVFRHLGAEVTLIQRGPRLLPEYEPEVSEAVGLILDRLGTQVLTGTHVQQVERTRRGRRLVVTHGETEKTIDTEQVIVATGRQPNVESLNLSAAGIDTDNHGTPTVDDQLRTTNRRVWAAGDVTLSPQFVYVAAYQGGLAAENALTGAGRQVDLRALPSVVFTSPQIAAVGHSRQQAEAAGHAVMSVALPISAVPRALVNYEQEGTFVLIADEEIGTLLGAQVVADNAGDVIYAATLAVKHGLTISDLAESFAPYLTMAEGLKLGALAFTRDISKLSCCAA